MQKTVIALQGASNRGKTESIRLAYERLLQQGAEVIRYPLRSRSRDVRQAILGIDGVKVGFASSGDTVKRLEEDLPPLCAAECSVIVCATHTSRSETVSYVERLALEHAYQVVAIKKERAALVNAERANLETADAIIRQVRTAIEAVQLVQA
jgi:hypothetical protein